MLSTGGWLPLVFRRVFTHVRMVGRLQKLQPSTDDICISYSSDRRNISQHGLYFHLATARRVDHSDKLTASQAIEAMQSFFSMLSLEACRNPAGRLAYLQGQMKAAAWKG